MITRAEAERLRQDPRIRAFLDMIAEAEGADYQTLVHHGRKNKVLKELSRHPGIVVKEVKGRPIPKNLWSTAAGRYQFLKRTWDRLARALNLPDFSPKSQDLAAIALLAEAKAIDPILRGDIQTAIYRARKIWASFPGAGYGQGERKMSQMIAWYNSSLEKFKQIGQVINDNTGNIVLVLLGLGIFF
ncbi:MAG: glycoside hydrolase family 104 protein [Acidobacteriota bacterium]|nr:glycoside hydrolase family 104 protein [Leptospiraceae bacterium]MDW8305375.1 glycoside hydrolase family 104 protein [Acidobacteriota bacterium]